MTKAQQAQTAQPQRRAAKQEPKPKEPKATKAQSPLLSAMELRGVVDDALELQGQIALLEKELDVRKVRIRAHAQAQRRTEDSMLEYRGAAGVAQVIFSGTWKVAGTPGMVIDQLAGSGIVTVEPKITVPKDIQARLDAATPEVRDRAKALLKYEERTPSVRIFAGDEAQA